MLDRTTTPVRASLYLGSVRADAVCNRHGAMIEQGPPIIRRAGRVYAACESVALFSCPECCLDLFADVGEPNHDPDQVVDILWKRYLDDGWDDSLRELFVDLGSGRLEQRGGLSVVLSGDSDFDEADAPEYLRGRVARLV